MDRKKNESYLSFSKRVTRALSNKTISYKEWAKSLLNENIYGEENTRRCFVFFEKFLSILENDEINNIQDENKLQEILIAKKELEKERKKIQTINLEYNQYVRDISRFELFNEKIKEAIDNMPALIFSNTIQDKFNSKQTAVLCISDAHNGVEINMQTVFNEPINIYSPDILKKRLNKLADTVIKDYKNNFNYKKLIVFDLGDGIQNILRLSDIAKLKTGVIDSVLQYAEMISQFLNKIQNELNIQIEFSCLGGNHSELRLISTGRNWESENLGKVIREFIALRLKDNQNIKVDPYSDFSFKQIEGINILAIHGDDSKKNINEISYWEQYHNITIDILLMGHFHHQEQISLGYSPTGDKEIIIVPSLIGIDEFSRKNRKLARAGAKFILFEDNNKTWEKVIYLN
ncbi:hypothetical protein [Faecalibacillus intestinalis]|jgi:hypothetical protein|uniref:hypothetical protein n=1 Tax=Faecalibacillus intestinalis TaxID=1982626 RepID=UPI003991854A